MFRSIAKNLIPSNFKENKVINDVLDIFVDYIYENSNLVLDINNLYSEKNEVLFEEIIKVYASNFYKTIMDGSKNHKLAKSVKLAHEKWGIDFDTVKLDLSVVKLLSKNQLELFKNFQQTKGTLRSIEFIYRIIEQLNIESFVLETDGQLVIKPGKNVFEYIVEGSMLPEIFEAFVKPLAHPVGWVYLFIRTYSLYFTDYFLSQEVYDVEIFKIECSNDECSDDFISNEGYLFETDENGNIIYEDRQPKKYKAIKSPVINITRFGINYPELTLPSEICLVDDPTILTIETQDIKNDKSIKIFFKSGEYLEQHSNPSSLILYYGKGLNNLNQTIKKDYTPFLKSCALHLSYNRKVVTTIKDSVKFQIDFGFSNTTGNIAAIGAGNLFVNSPSWILGNKYLQNNAATTYKTRVKDEVLRATDYNALYKINDNKIRPLFSRIESSFLRHIERIDLDLYKKNDKGQYYYIAPKNSVFLDCLNKNDIKVNVDVELTNDSFIIKSDIRKISLLYWVDYLKKVKRYQITSADIKEANENDKNGRYYFESRYPIIGIFKDNIRVSCDVFINEYNEYKVYADDLDNCVVLYIDENNIGIDERQLASEKIILNASNKFTVELDLNECFVLGFYNNSKNRINLKYAKNVNTNEFDKIIISSDLVAIMAEDARNTNDFYLPDKNEIDPYEITLKPYFTNQIDLNGDSAELDDLEVYSLNTAFNSNYEIHAEIFYLKNIKDQKTVVYFENHRIDTNELPLEIRLNTRTHAEYSYITDINELNLESNILKLYYDLDVKDKEAQLICLDAKSELLEEVNFILSKTINANIKNDNLYEAIFDSQLQKSYDLWLSEVYRRDSSLDYNNYVGWFATNDDSYDSGFIGISDKLEYKLRRTGNSGLIAIDTFEIKSSVGSGQTDIIFEFTDHIPNITDVFDITNIGVYQNKYGWQNLYVDKYLENKFLPLFNESVQLNDLTKSLDVIDMLDDYYVPEFNNITDPMPKRYPVSGILLTNDYYVLEFNDLDIKSALFYFVNNLDSLHKYLNKINSNPRYSLINGTNIALIHFLGKPFGYEYATAKYVGDELSKLSKGIDFDSDIIYIQPSHEFYAEMKRNGQVSTLIELNKISDVYTKNLKNKILLRFINQPFGYEYATVDYVGDELHRLLDESKLI